MECPKKIKFIRWVGVMKNQKGVSRDEVVLALEELDV